MSSLFPNGIKGLSDSKWSGVPGSADKLVGIDLHSTPGLIKVHQKLTKNSGETVTELCKHKVGASNGTTLWFSSESGKIWREVSGTWSLVHTTVPTSGGAACLGAAEFENWIYWATEDYIHRIHVDDINGTWSNYVYQNHAAFTVGDDEAHPMVEQNLELFLGDKTVISKISPPTTAASSPTSTLQTTLGSSVDWMMLAGNIRASDLQFPNILASGRASSPTVSITRSVEVFAVGGGGGGGATKATSSVGGGGGGGGGQIAQSTISLAEGPNTVTVGAGGAGATSAGLQGSNGASSVVGTLIAIGGGGGGGLTVTAGLTGASGGGGGGDTGSGPGAGGVGTAGNDGATAGTNPNGHPGGGGGGAGAAGSNVTGGAGTASSFTGSPVTYAGGGGGGSGDSASAGSGGTGGGGGGGTNGAGTAGTANTGGGGGGGGNSVSGGTRAGGAGGSGVVIIRYLTGTMSGSGGTITTSGGYTIHTFTTSGTFIVFGTTLSLSLAVPPGHNRALYVLAANYTSTLPASATFGGTAMTLVTSGTGGGGTAFSYGVFRLLTPSAGTADVVVTWAGFTTDMTITAFVADKVNQTTPNTSFAASISSGTTAEATLSGATEYGLRIAFVVSNTATHAPLTAGLTEVLDATNNAGRDSLSYLGVSVEGSLVETDFNLKAPERITTLEPFDVDLLVGTRVPNANKASVKRWDTASPSWSAEDQLDESSVNAFIRDDNYVYVQAGDFGRLYFYNGEQLLPYKRVPGEWSPSKAGKVNQSAVATLLGIPVFGLSNVSGNPALQGVYSFGSYSKDYEKTLDLSFPVSSGNFSGVEIGAVLVKGADLYASWKDASGAGVDKLDYTAKYASAYIETRMLSGPNDRGVLKTALEACAYYASLPASTGITFGYKKKYDADYTSITPVTDTKLCAVEAQESIPEVANLQLKFGFTVNGNNAPEVEDFAYMLAPLKK